jgi:hypothetical protein
VRAFIKREAIPEYLRKYQSLLKPEEAYVMDTVFLRQLIKGDVGLFELIEGDNTKYFIWEKNKELNELKYVVVPRQVVDDDKEIVGMEYIHYKYYITTLLELSGIFSDNNLTHLIKTARYNAFDFINIVQIINQKRGAPFAIAARPVRKQMTWFVGVSGGLTSLETYEDLPSDYIKPSVGSYLSLSAGFNFVAREGLIRIQGMLSRADYFTTTNPNEPQARVRHTIQQYCFTPEASGFITIVGNTKWKLYTGGGFQFPLVLLHREKLEPPGSSSKARNFSFESLGWTVCHSSLVRISSRWELGYTITMPTIIHERETGIYYFPANYCAQLMYHFR